MRLFLASLIFVSVIGVSYADEIEILHWWTSDGERAAASVIQTSLQEKGILWKDAAIEGGGGEGAMAVLKSRVLQGKAPAAAQIIGPDIQHWADLNFLGHFNIVAMVHDWPNKLHPTVDQLVQHRDQYVAVPFGVHRINWLWIHKESLLKSGKSIPENWAEFFQLTEVFSQQGIVPIAHGNEPWQNATLFEVILLSVGGPTFYKEVFVEHREEAITSEAFAESLNLLALLKTKMDSNINGRTWQQATEMVASGRAGMQIMGDWVLGELNAWQMHNDVVCAAVPQSVNKHLYSIDTMVMFNNPELSSYETQLAFAETVLNRETQLSYSLAKGAIPVRSDIDASLLQSCSRASYKTFVRNESEGNLSPSLAHSMAAQSEIEDVFVDVIHNFFQSPSVPVKQVQEKLVANLRSVRK